MPRGRGEDGERHMGLLKLVQVLSFLVVFVAGIIIGLATSSHINTYFSSQAQAQLFSTSTATSFRVSSGTTKANCSQKVDCFSMDAFLHPTNLSHKMSDEELFWRASMAPYKNEFPFPRVPKVAFMFLTRGPLPLLPLWERFFKGHEKYFSIYLHTPPVYHLNVSSHSPFYGRQIPSQVPAIHTLSLFICHFLLHFLLLQD